MTARFSLSEMFRCVVVQVQAKYLTTGPAGVGFTSRSNTNRLGMVQSLDVDDPALVISLNHDTSHAASRELIRSRPESPHYPARDPRASGDWFRAPARSAGSCLSRVPPPEGDTPLE